MTPYTGAPRAPGGGRLPPFGRRRNRDPLNDLTVRERDVLPRRARASQPHSPLWGCPTVELARAQWWRPVSSRRIELDGARWFVPGAKQTVVAQRSRRNDAPERCTPDRSRGSDAIAEQALISRAQRGGRREREELVNAYLPMIASVARAYRRSTAVGRDELTQEGVVGLLRALERYDPDRGVPFWGYAAWWVRQAMQQVVSELSGPMVLSDRALRQLARVKHAQRRFEQTSGRELSSTELSAIVGMPRSQIESLVRSERSARGLDEPAGAEARDGTTVGDLVADPPAQEAYDRVPEQVLAAQIPGLLGCLTDRERTVICRRYGLDRREQTLREVAPVLGVSAERVRQIEQESLAKLHAAVAGRGRRRGGPGVGRRSHERCARLSEDRISPTASIIGGGQEVRSRPRGAPMPARGRVA